MTPDTTNDFGGNEQEFVFAADLGGTHLRAAVIDGDGKIYFRQMQTTPKTQNPNEIVSAFVVDFRECEQQLTRLGGQISAVSIAVPGTVNAGEEIVVKAPNLPCLNGFGLGSALLAELGCPVILENDANAAAVGEMWQGAGQGHRTLVCVTLGTGVGGGIILDGKLWRGVDGSAGEFGHIGVEPFGGVRCSCGSQGCLEVYASATAIVRMTREASPRYPNSLLQNEPDLTSENIYEAGKAGDELAIAVFRKMGNYLGIGLATLINVLNPEIIIIGGGLSNGWDLFEKHMHQQVLERAFPIAGSSVKIVRAQCGDNAGLLGAGNLALMSLNEEDEGRFLTSS